MNFKRTIIASCIVAFFAAGFLTEVFAVEPPSYKTRQKAEAWHRREVKRKAKQQRESGCTYGRDKVTGKCYEPREGQFYRDPATGEVKVKKIEKANLPWK